MVFDEKKSEWKEGENRPGYLGSGYRGIYETSYKMWKEQPIIGFGLKSFRAKCWEILPRIEGLACANHPHNYYLELLSEVGIIGFILMIIFFIILSKKFFDLNKVIQKTLC